MSDSFERRPTPANDMLALARESMRKRLGQLMDILMDSKIKIAQKLSDQIAGENDPEKLMALRTMLNDVLFSTDDITQFDANLKALLSMLDNNMKVFVALRKLWIAEVKNPPASRPPSH